MVFALNADRLFDLFTFVEDDHGRDRLHAVIDGGLLIVIDVQIADFGLATVFGRQLFHDGRRHAAGTTPGSPEVDQDGDVAFEDFFFKVGVSEFDQVFSHQAIPFKYEHCCLPIGQTGMNERQRRDRHVGSGSSVNLDSDCRP